MLRCACPTLYPTPSPLQADSAESAAEELESRRRRAEFLKRLRAATAKKLDELMARLASLEAKAQGMVAYTMTLSDKLVSLSSLTIFFFELQYL